MNKSLLIAILAIIALTPSLSRAQNRAPAIAVLGNSHFVQNGKASNFTLTRDQILANPHLSIQNSGCPVTGFTFSVLPKGKDVWGPMTVKGSSDLTTQIKSFLKDMEVPEGRIFIENITAMCASGPLNVTPIVITMVPNTSKK